MGFYDARGGVRDRLAPLSPLTVDARSALRFFAFCLANATPDPEILGDIEAYRPHFVEFGSELEMVVAIFTNVIEFDEQTGRPTNESDARRRAAPWIRSYCDPGYGVRPPFAAWKIKLH